MLIAVDLDDTLAATTPAVLAHASKLLDVKMLPGDITSKDYWLQYGVSDVQAIQIVHSYNLAGFPGLQPLPAAQEVLESLARKHQLCVITSRDPAAEADTKRWVAEHYPNIFGDIICVGNRYTSKNARSKSELCHELGIEVMIDDSIAHLGDCLADGVSLAVLFGDYAWNQHSSLPRGMQVAKDWRAVKGLLE